MIKLKRLLIESALTFKKSTNGEFMQFTFFDSDGLITMQNKKEIGQINVRLKRGWNQLHISIESEFQGKGYAARMIGMIINVYDYISIPEGRIINADINSVIRKLQKNFNYYKTKYNEHILYNDKISINKIREIFE